MLLCLFLGNVTFNSHIFVTFIFLVHFFKTIDAVHLLDQQINNNYSICLPLITNQSIKQVVFAYLLNNC